MFACVHVCASVIGEIKRPFQDNAIYQNHVYLIQTLNRLNLCHVGLSFYFLCAADVALCVAFDRTI